MTSGLKLRSVLLRGVMRIPTAVLAGLVAGSIVGLAWFSTASYLATGDVTPMRRSSVLETVRGLWNHQNSGGGGISYEVARLWEHIFASLGDSLPFSGPSMGQRLFYASVFGYGAWGLARLIAQYVQREWIVIFSSVIGVFAPYVAMQAPTPVPLLAIGMSGAVLSEYVRVWRGKKMSLLWWCLTLLPASYACINPPLLAVVLMISLAGIPASIIIEKPGSRALKAGTASLLLKVPVVAMSMLWWAVPFVLTLMYAKSSGTIKAVTDVSSWSWTHRNSSIVNVLTQTANWGAPDKFYIGGADFYFKWPARAATFVIPAMVFVAPFLVSGKRRKLALILLFVYASSALLSQGLHAPFGVVNEMLYAKIPGFFLFREPFSKFGVLMVLAGALSGGLALEEIVERGGRKLAGGSYFVTLTASLIVASLTLVTHPVWLGTAMDRTAPTRVSVPKNWLRAADALNSSKTNGRALVLPLADFYQMPTVWGYYGIDSLPRQLIKRPVLQRLPENYIADSSGLDGLMLEVEQAASFGDTKRVENILEKLGVSHIVVRKDYDYNSPYRRIPMTVTAAQYGELANEMKLEPVFSSPLVDIYEVGGPEGIHVGVPVLLDEAEPTAVSLLGKNQTGVTNKVGIENLLTLNPPKTEYAGDLGFYQRGNSRLALSGDGGSLESVEKVSIGNEIFYLENSVRLPKSAAGVVVNGVPYGRQDPFYIPFGLPYSALVPLGEPTQTALEASACKPVSSCFELQLPKIGDYTSVFAEVSIDGEVKSACFKDRYGACETTPIRDGVLRYVSDDSEHATSLIVEGRGLKNFTAVLVGVDNKSLMWNESALEDRVFSVDKGERVLVNDVSVSDLSLSDFTDCAGNKDVKSGGVRSLSGGGLVVRGGPARVCSGIDLPRAFAGANIDVEISGVKGEAEFCLFDHEADRCVDSTSGTGEISVSAAVRYFSDDPLTLYMYSGGGGASLSRVRVRELSPLGSYLTSDNKEVVQGAALWDWESDHGSLRVGPGRQRAVSLSEQYSGSWSAKTVSGATMVEVNGYATGWLIPGEQEVVFSVKNAHHRTMLYLWLATGLAFVLAWVSKKRSPR